MPLHLDLNPGDIHKIHNFEYADEAARTGASITSDDVGKVAVQLDNNTYWILIDDTPTWTQITNEAGGGGTVTATEGADGYLAFFTGANSIAGDNDFFWDRVNNRVGIGTTSPSAKLEVRDDQDAGTSIIIKNNDTGTSARSYIAFESNDNFNNGYAELAVFGSNWSDSIDGIVRGGSADLHGNGNNFLIRSVSGPMHLMGGNKQTVTLNQLQHVGIGTTFPIEPLTVNGPIALQEQGSTPATEDGYGKLYTDSSGDLKYVDDDGVNNRVAMINSDGYLLPESDDTQSLGNPTTRWESLFLGPESLHFVSTDSETGVGKDWKLGIGTDEGQGNLQIHQGEGKRFTFTEDGRMGIGTSAPIPRGIEIVKDSGDGNPQLGLTYYTTSNDRGTFDFRRARGTFDSPSAVQADDLLGTIGFLGYTGSVFQNAASIDGLATETWSGSAEGTEIQFQVTTAGETTRDVAAKVTPGSLQLGSTNRAAMDLEFHDGSNYRDVIRYDSTIFMGDVETQGGTSKGVTIRTGGGDAMRLGTDKQVAIGGAFDAVNTLDVEGGCVIGATRSGSSTAPTNGLLVEGRVGLGDNTSPNGFIHASGSAGADTTMHFTNSTASRTYTLGPWTDGLFYISDATAGADRFYLSSSGNFGLGRSPSSNRLEVDGNASKDAAGDWLANSDARIKTDVRTITNGLEVIRQLNPVAFKYTEDYMKSHPSLQKHDYYNFIAQEFQKIFPDYVKDSGEEGGILQIDTGAIRPHMVAAVQELADMVDEQRKMIEELRKELNDIKNKS